MSFHSRIQNSAQEIVRLHQKLHAAIARRGDGPREHALWEAACHEFHARYEELSFPGGHRTAPRDRLRSGDLVAIEYALAFLEIRPYFFRSGSQRSGYKSNSVYCLREGFGGFGVEVLESAAKSSVFSNRVMLRICNIP